MARSPVARFYVSPLFWAEICQTPNPSLDDKRKAARGLLMAWDNQVREVKRQDWRSQDETRFSVDQEFDLLLQRCHARGISRTQALLSAALQQQETQAPPARAQDHACAQDNAQACVGGAVAPAGMGDLTPEQVAILRGKIIAMRKQAIETLRRAGGYVFAEEGGGGDEADRAQLQMQAESRHAEVERARQMLVQADAALARMMRGEYGWCEETGEPIGWARLLANPLARYSVDAQQRRERRQALGVV